MCPTPIIQVAEYPRRVVARYRLDGRSYHGSPYANNMLEDCIRVPWSKRVTDTDLGDTSFRYPGDP